MSTFTHTPNYINPDSIGWKLTDTHVVSFSFALVIVLARCYTKFSLVKSSGWDDYTIIGALLLSLGRLIIDEIGTHRFGVGRHFWDIPPDRFNGFLTVIAVDGYLHIVAITIAKVSLLLFLYRIFRVNRKFRIAAWILGSILVVWATMTVLMAIFSCRPLTASWNLKQYLDPKTVCKPKAYDVTNIYGFCNAVTDAVLIVLPIPLLRKMQITFKRKLGVAMVFATGIFVFAVAIVRQYISYSASAADPSWDIVVVKIWMVIELNVAIIVACLPALSPLVKKIPVLASVVPFSIRSRFSLESAKRRAPWPRVRKSSTPIYDPEQGGQAPRNYDSNASWSKPRAWRDAERKQFGSSDNMSQDTGQSVPLVEQAKLRTPLHS